MAYLQGVPIDVRKQLYVTIWNKSTSGQTATLTIPSMFLAAAASLTKFGANNLIPGYR
jgi:hypothetical protein